MSQKAQLKKVRPARGRFCKWDYYIWTELIHFHDDFIQIITQISVKNAVNFTKIQEVI